MAVLVFTYFWLFVLNNSYEPVSAISTDDFYTVQEDVDDILEPGDGDFAEVTLSQPFPFHQSNHSFFIVGCTYII